MTNMQEHKNEGLFAPLPVMTFDTGRRITESMAYTPRSWITRHTGRGAYVVQAVFPVKKNKIKVAYTVTSIVNPHPHKGSR